MANLEIERRFLVRTARWRGIRPDAREHIVQFYLTTGPDLAVRVRITGDRATLTAKGPTAGAARQEIETGIDPDAARALLDARLYRGTPIQKTRSTVIASGLTFEVDEFDADNAGLVIVEVEFRGDAGERAAWEEQVNRDRPSWLGREITGEHRFANSELALRPFGAWPVDERDAVLREMNEPD